MSITSIKSQQKLINSLRNVVQLRTKQEKYILFSMLQYAAINVYSNMKIKSYKKIFILLKVNL
jgi:hypothetical protein